jgi:hypothetical protein
MDCVKIDLRTASRDSRKRAKGVGKARSIGSDELYRNGAGPVPSDALSVVYGAAGLMIECGLLG